MAINYVNIREHLIRLFEINLLYYIMIWKVLGILYLLGMIWLVWEAMNAPLMPDDYDLSIEEEEIMKDIESRNDDGNTKDN